MADSSSEHPYGTCHRCGADIWQSGGSPGDYKCPPCKGQQQREREDCELADRAEIKQNRD